MGHDVLCVCGCVDVTSGHRLTRRASQEERTCVKKSNKNNSIRYKKTRHRVKKGHVLVLSPECTHTEEMG